VILYTHRMSEDDSARCVRFVSVTDPECREASKYIARPTFGSGEGSVPSTSPSPPSSRDNNKSKEGDGSSDEDNEGLRMNTMMNAGGPFRWPLDAGTKRLSACSDACFGGPSVTPKSTSPPPVSRSNSGPSIRFEEKRRDTGYPRFGKKERRDTGYPRFGKKRRDTGYPVSNIPSGNSRSTSSATSEVEDDVWDVWDGRKVDRRDVRPTLSLLGFRTSFLEQEDPHSLLSELSKSHSPKSTTPNQRSSVISDDSAIPFHSDAVHANSGKFGPLASSSKFNVSHHNQGRETRHLNAPPYDAPQPQPPERDLRRETVQVSDEFPGLNPFRSARSPPHKNNPYIPYTGEPDYRDTDTPGVAAGVLVESFENAPRCGGRSASSAQKHVRVHEENVSLDKNSHPHEGGGPSQHVELEDNKCGRVTCIPSSSYAAAAHDEPEDFEGVDKPDAAAALCDRSKNHHHHYHHHTSVKHGIQKRARRPRRQRPEKDKPEDHESTDTESDSIRSFVSVPSSLAAASLERVPTSDSLRRRRSSVGSSATAGDDSVNSGGDASDTNASVVASLPSTSALRKSHIHAHVPMKMHTERVTYMDPNPGSDNDGSHHSGEPNREKRPPRHAPKFKHFSILGLQLNALLNLPSSAQQGKPQTQFALGVVPSLVVLSQHRLLSTLMVQALQLGSLRQRLPQSRRPSDCSARPPAVLRPPSMKAPSATAQPPPLGLQGNPHTHLWLRVVPSLVVFSQQRLLSLRIVQASQVRSS